VQLMSLRRLGTAALPNQEFGLAFSRPLVDVQSLDQANKKYPGGVRNQVRAVCGAVE